MVAHPEGATSTLDFRVKDAMPKLAAGGHRHAFTTAWRRLGGLSPLEVGVAMIVATGWHGPAAGGAVDQTSASEQHQTYKSTGGETACAT